MPICGSRSSTATVAPDRLQPRRLTQWRRAVIGQVIRFVRIVPAGSFRKTLPHRAVHPARERDDPRLPPPPARGRSPRLLAHGAAPLPAAQRIAGPARFVGRTPDDTGVGDAYRLYSPPEAEASCRAKQPSAWRPRDADVPHEGRRPTRGSPTVPMWNWIGDEPATTFSY